MRILQLRIEIDSERETIVAEEQKRNATVPPITEQNVSPNSHHTQVRNTYTETHF